MSSTSQPNWRGGRKHISNFLHLIILKSIVSICHHLFEFLSLFRREVFAIPTELIKMAVIWHEKGTHHNQIASSVRNYLSLLLQQQGNKFTSELQSLDGRNTWKSICEFSKWVVVGKMGEQFIKQGWDFQWIFKLTRNLLRISWSQGLKL